MMRDGIASEWLNMFFLLNGLDLLDVVFIGRANIATPRYV
jgi:hypothetical protein